MIDDDDDFVPLLLAFEQKPLSAFGPEMVRSVEDLHSLILVAKNVLVGSKLRDVNATNILGLVEMMLDREIELKGATND